MRLPQRTQGATLIVSVLFVMVILSVVMAVTAQVTLSTRRSGVDQQRVLAARYAAESGVAQVQTRLRVMQALLDAASIPPGATAQVEARIREVCAGAVLPAPAASGATVCTFADRGLDDSPGRVSLFMLAVPAAEFARLGFRGTTDGDRADYWMAMFSGADGRAYRGGDDRSGYQTRFGLQPSRLERWPDGYRLYFTVPGLTSVGTAGAVTQQIRARASTSGRPKEYFVWLSRPSFASYALFTNHHFQSAAAEASGQRINFTKRTLFSGPVHTNQHFLFEGDAGGQPLFWGQVTSAGCPDGRVGTVSGMPGCTAAAQPGAYFDASAGNFVAAAAMTPSAQAPDSGDNRPQFRSTVQWDADFIPLPSNNQDQNAAAREGGLLLGGDVDQLRLFREVVAGTERQRISYRQGDRQVQLSYGPDGRLFLWNDATDTWITAGRDAEGSIVPSATQATFNGVISVDGGGISALDGGPNAALSGPAGASIASFAGITVAASGSVTVTSSLKYTVPPCGGENGADAPARCDDLDARNILGVYSSGGDIDLVSPRSCPGGDGSCPNVGENPQIHAVLMASQGAVQVRGFDVGSPLGSVSLIGGVIENYYGAFGQFNASGPTHGYGRNFVYDQRTAAGYVPPSFPTQTNWTIRLATEAADGSVRPLPGSGRGIRLQGDTLSVGKGGL